MKHILHFTIAMLFFIPVPFVQAEETGVLFRRKVFGKLGWHKEGNEEKNEKYLGEIENGEPNGIGNITYHIGIKYVGDWKDGKQHGQGTLTLPNGEKYVGEWENGERHGQGTYTWSDGHKL